MWVRSMAITFALVGCRSDSGGPPPPPPPAAVGDPLWSSAWPTVPQVPDAVALYESLQPFEAAALHAGLLACRIDAAENPATRDVFSGPDLAMEMTLGAGPSMIVRGKSDSWRSTVTLAAIDLARGAEVRAVIWDHDDLTDGEHIAELAGRFTGAFPLRLANAAATVECRAVPANALEVRVIAALSAADSALDAFAATPVAEFVSNRARSNKQVNAARRAITKAASHVGWHVDRVRERVARAEELERDWQRRLQEARDERIGRLPALGERVTIDGARLSVAGALDCDAQRIEREVARVFPGQAPGNIGCLLRVDVTPVPGATFDWYSYSVGAKLVARDGEEFEVHETWAEIGGAPMTHRPPTLTPGMRISVVYTAGGLAAQAPPELAAISVRKETVLVRVR